MSKIARKLIVITLLAVIAVVYVLGLEKCVSNTALTYVLIGTALWVTAMSALILRL